MVIKVAFKVKRHGMQWTIGNLADFKVNDKVVSEGLKKCAKPIRVLMPVQGFDVFNNSNRIRTNVSDRNSSSSSCSNTHGIDGYLLVENPIFINEMCSE